VQNALHIADLQRMRDLRQIESQRFLDLQNQRQIELQQFPIKQEEQVLPQTKKHHKSKTKTEKYEIYARSMNASSNANVDSGARTW